MIKSIEKIQKINQSHKVIFLDIHGRGGLVFTTTGWKLHLLLVLATNQITR